MKSIYIATLFFPLVFAAEYLVGVGKDETTGKKGLGYDPSVIHPTIGDTIVFEFRSGVHSSVESTFAKPCTPKADGVNSGVHTVEDSLSVDAEGLPRYQFTLASTDPMWFMDQAGGECHHGAILAINPNATETPALFKENAKNDQGITTPSSSSHSASFTGTGTGAPAAGSSDTSTPNFATRTQIGSQIVGLAAIAALTLGLL